MWFPFRDKDSRITRFHHPQHIELRTHDYLFIFLESPEGHPSTQQNPKRQHLSWAFRSLPSISLTQGPCLKSLDPLAAILLEKPRGQNHSLCAQLLGKTPTMGPLKQGKERRAVSLTPREVQKRFDQEARSVISPQKAAMTHRTGWSSTMSLPSKSQNNLGQKPFNERLHPQINRFLSGPRTPTNFLLKNFAP